MITDKCFTEEWLNRFKNQKVYQRIDKIIFEKMIYALHLLERIKANGLDFVFKGGTSLLLLLQEENRFSIDIDIICNSPRNELEAILQKVVASSRFINFELDTHRSYRPGVPKAHYIFAFRPMNGGKYSGTILLDVLIEDSIYPELTKKPIATKWIESLQETMITVPSIDSIFGDKLTAFAPNTIGIPYFKGIDKRSFSMEICKQLFDLSKLFEKIENLETVAKSFHAFAIQEIEYRNNGDSQNSLHPSSVLQDTFDTCLILARRGKGTTDEKAKFFELQKGIKAFGTGFLMAGNFRIDDAVHASGKIAYLAAKLLHQDLTPIQFFNEKEANPPTITDPEWSFLNKLRKHPNKSGYYYWHKTIQTITKQANTQAD